VRCGPPFATASAARSLLQLRLKVRQVKVLPVLLNFSFAVDDQDDRIFSRAVSGERISGNVSVFSFK
jgi:hypothetical protein